MARYLIGNIKGPAGPTGPTGPQGPQGIQGPKGEDGNSFDLLGMYPTLAALEAEHPTGVKGDAWAVGTVSANTVYI